MGFAATSDSYCLCGYMALQGMENSVKMVVDILLFDDDFSTHLQRIRQMLFICCEHGTTLNKDKFVEPRVRFCGYDQSAVGVYASKHRVSAIRDFPTPANLTNFRSFMGLVNQLSKLTLNRAAAANLFAPL